MIINCHVAVDGMKHVKKWEMRNSYKILVGKLKGGN